MGQSVLEGLAGERRATRFESYGTVYLVLPAQEVWGLVYTSTSHNCVIHCPCTICTDPNAECKLFCKTEACSECTSQCQEHKIKLPRLFNSNSDLVTMKIDMYQFATPHAGIPLNCLKCTDDVLEHQIFHLVFHTRCRFCSVDKNSYSSRRSQL